ncbi:hypothetical protein HN592_03265 [Candidatus Woesearchaeota archaeon]|jgi:hypothetical protein|nr:hypothetical protein [Candidatus Woesearchaeota archaeon]MBT4368231.1 hypothetical protein [Candidatus Woesearchaeota archaeon]MBT4712720.1 hypothetical protein [Candidatus Woesearchaeota archaeon]MBT6639632.1 hypothetical protein [Candidatus Woesearchaeota archaeon]MBT7133804.1 hypothetical protein [Candidatus Woesearchaeota archaeon]
MGRKKIKINGRFKGDPLIKIEDYTESIIVPLDVFYEVLIEARAEFKLTDKLIKLLVEKRLKRA